MGGGRRRRDRRIEPGHASVLRATVLAAALSLGHVLGPGPERRLTAQEGAEGPTDVIAAPSVFLLGGAFVRTDFQGEGTSLVVDARVRFPLTSRLRFEPGIGYVGFEADEVPEGVGPDARLVLLDFQLQYEVLDGPVRPYVGVGAGGAVDFRDERGTEDFALSTFSASAGVSFDVVSALLAATEFRYRTLDEFDDKVFVVALGVGWRL